MQLSPPEIRCRVIADPHVGVPGHRLADLASVALLPTSSPQHAFSPLTKLSSLLPTASKCQMMEERANLMHMMKLSIKVLLQSALSLGRSLDAEHAPLQQFFVVMEHCLKHGLKGEPGGRVGRSRWRRPGQMLLSMYSSVSHIVLAAGITAMNKIDKVPAYKTRHS